MPCIVCGKKRNLKKIKFPFGSFEVCWGHNCSKKLSQASLDFVPCAGFNLAELTDNDKFTPEELEAMHLTDDDEIELADFHADAWWNNDSVGDSYREALEFTAQEAERLSLSRIPRKDLPLKIGGLKFKENEPELEKQLKKKG